MTKRLGIFVVSLDFELYWGVRDRRALNEYRDNLFGVRAVVPALLQSFAEHDIHATWATVGFLFFQKREQLQAALPPLRPCYRNASLSPYDHLSTIGSDEEHDPFHYAGSLVRLIGTTPGQEIATHTFSHYYCLEEGSDLSTFRADLEAALQTAKAVGISIHSIVFPRNQIRADLLVVCRDLGIRCYRGTETTWVYRPAASGKQSWFKRGLRLLDSYFNLYSHNCHALEELHSTTPYNIPSSRFLRPYIPRRRFRTRLHLKRIRDGLSHAAERGLVYHLWWHPHNMGKYPRENLAYLQEILDHYRRLRDRIGMESLNMREVADRLEVLANGK